MTHGQQLLHNLDVVCDVYALRLGIWNATRSPVASMGQEGLKSRSAAAGSRAGAEAEWDDKAVGET